MVLLAAAVALLVLPAATHAAPTVDDVRVTDRPGGGAIVTVTGTWDRDLLRRATPQRGTIGLQLHRGGRPVAARLGWSTDLHRGTTRHFRHRFRLTAEQARGLRRTRDSRRSGASHAAATVKPIVSHLVDVDADGLFEVGATSDDQCSQVGPGVDLAGCRLNGVHWPGVDLSGANLEGTALASATLTGANLSSVQAMMTDLTGATLDGASFLRAAAPTAILRNASARNIRVVLSDFSAAVLTGAQLDGSMCTESNWGNGVNVTTSPCPSS